MKTARSERLTHLLNDCVNLQKEVDMLLRFSNFKVDLENPIGNLLQSIDICSLNGDIDLSKVMRIKSEKKNIIDNVSKSTYIRSVPKEGKERSC